MRALVPIARAVDLRDVRILRQRVGIERIVIGMDRGLEEPTAMIRSGPRFHDGHAPAQRFDPRRISNEFGQRHAHRRCRMTERGHRARRQGHPERPCPSDNFSPRDFHGIPLRAPIVTHLFRTPIG